MLSTLKELMVLQFVRDHLTHGYALASALESSLGWTLGMTRPTVYQILQRLEKRGSLTRKEDREGRYPEKQVYSITREGKREYSRLLEKAINPGWLSIQPFAALVLHVDGPDHEKRREALEELRQTRHSLREQLADFPPHDGSIGVALRLMSRQLQLEIDAIDELM